MKIDPQQSSKMVRHIQKRPSQLFALLVINVALAHAQAIPADHLANIAKAQIKIAETDQLVSLDLQAPTTVRRGYVTRLSFRSANHNYSLHSKYEIRRLVPPTTPPAVNQDFGVNNLQFDRSNYFMSSHYSNSNGNHALLFFFGDGIQSDVDSLLVIGFTSDGTPHKILESGALDITVFLPPEGNEPARIIGKSSLSQVMAGEGGNGSTAPYATTYDPFIVYVLSTSSGNATYSLQESRTYNQSHYVWAGPQSREDYAVLYNIPGHRKPFGEPATKAAETIRNVSRIRQ